MDDIRLRAYAKINLFLEIIGKRRDGYHNLETVFQSVDLHDLLVIRPTHRRPEQNYIQCDHPTVPTDVNNLAWKAATLLQTHYPQINGIEIRIQKRIPVAAGLGGGSANAAAVLLGLNHLYDLRLSDDDLRRLGSQLGADVPFFFMGGTVLGEGIGNQLTPLNPLPEVEVVLANSGVHISTPWVYQQLKLPLTVKNRDVRIVSQFIEHGDLRNLGANMFNRLETPVFANYPELERLKQVLVRGCAYGALMSGSGATLFALAADKSQAQQLASSLQCGSVLCTRTTSAGLEVA